MQVTMVPPDSFSADQMETPIQVGQTDTIPYKTASCSAGRFAQKAGKERKNLIEYAAVIVSALVLVSLIFFAVHRSVVQLRQNENTHHLIQEHRDLRSQQRLKQFDGNSDGTIDEESQFESLAAIQI